MIFYNRKLTTFTWDEISTILKSGIKEGVQLEFKREIPNRLEKVLSAFANTNGGCIIIGVDENEDGSAKLPLNCINPEGLTEKIYNIATNAISPSLDIEEMHYFKNPNDESEGILIIKILEGEGVYAIEQNELVYIRTGNISKPHRKAKIFEIEFLQKKMQNILDRKSKSLKKAEIRLSTVLESLTSNLQLEPSLRSISYPTNLNENFLDIESLYKYVLNYSADGFPFSQWVKLRYVENGIACHFEGRYSDIQTNGFVFNESFFNNGDKNFQIPQIARQLKSQMIFTGHLYSNFGYLGKIALEGQLGKIKNKNTHIHGSFTGQSTKISLDEVIDFEISGTVNEFINDSDKLLIPILRRILYTVDYSMEENEITNLIPKNIRVREFSKI